MQTVKKIVCILLVLVLCEVLPHTLSQNLARGKPVQSYDVFGGFAAERAVDGEYLPSLTKCAIITAPAGSAPEWYVDLGDSYRVQTIRIYNTDGSYGNPRRLTDFTLSVGTLSNRKACGPEFTGQVRARDSIDISCNQTGNIVWLRKKPGNGKSYITLCEVEVYGLEQYDCGLCPPSVSCNADTGCSQCQAGKTGPECGQDCPDGTHGVTCSATCGRCATGTTCDKVNGDCPDGCQLWFTDQRCQTRIKPPSVTNETIAVTDITNNSAIVTWDPLYSVPSELAQFYEYRVTYRERTTSYRDGPLVPHGTSPLSTQVTGLKHNTVYDFSIDTYRVMDNRRRSGDSYSFVSNRTTCNSPASPNITAIEAVNGTDESLGDVTVTYTALVDLNSGCENFTAIAIDFKHANETSYTSEPVILSATNFTFRPNFSGEFYVRVIVVNNEGLSAVSPLENVTVIDTRRDPTTTTAPTTAAGGPDGSDIHVIGPDPVTISVPVVLVLLAAVGVGLGVFFWRRRQAGSQRKGDILESDREANNRVMDDNERNAHTLPAPVNGIDNKMAIAISPSDDPDTGSGNKESMFDQSEAENIYANSAVAVASFEVYVKRRRQNMRDFEQEYKSMPKEDPKKCLAATANDNLARNRYKNIYAYDKNRVILNVANEEETDYINANYITGFRSSKDYIATQGPRTNTILEFWRMIWQVKANRIVMVANLMENSKSRCSEYWSRDSGASLHFNDFTITTEAVDVCADYTTSVLSVHKGPETMTVRHFHFTTWEDKSNPVYGVMSLLAFYKKVHSFDGISRGPMVVHCSAGVGRTGTFIVLDILMQQVKVNKQVDVSSCVQRARLERMHMVQTLEQYYFLHDALIEVIKCGDTSVPCSGFQAKYKALCASTNGLSELERQFKILTEAKDLRNAEPKDGILPQHVNKNRNKMVIPANNARPFLPGTEDDSYINAVFVDSYRHHDFYIATQLPLPHTVGDFWRLVQSQDTSTIIMLNHVSVSDQYWPTEEMSTSEYGGISVTLTETKHLHKCIISRTFNVAKTRRKAVTTTVRHFQLLTWPDDSELPPEPGHLLDLSEHVSRWHQQNTLSKAPGNTVVQCLDGVGHCGLYLAVTYMLDKMTSEQEVDPFFAVRYASRKRPEFCQTMEQYQFLYSVARDHLSEHNEYANV